MALDTLTYEKLDTNLFNKEVFKEGILDDSKQIIDPAFEIGCLEAQISDMLAGMDSNPDTKDEVLALIANYEEAIVILKS